MVGVVTKDILGVGALELADLIRRRELSPVEVVEAHLVRIDEVNSALNAVVVRRDRDALDEARRAERAVVAGERLGALHGVPFTTKEMIAVDGMPWTSGSTRRRGITAPATAVAIERVRQAGAILLGLTNVPEMGCWYETANCVYGRTSNPHDPRRTPGGSSGGEAAIVAAGGSAFGVGSDGAGSIRMPALFCGVFGHKPTGGLVPIRGHYPFATDAPSGGPADTQRSICIGPITRHADDLMPVVEVLAGRSLEGGVSFDGRNVLVLDDPRVRWATRTTPAMRAAVRRAADALGEAGARVADWNHEAVRDTFDIWVSMYELEFGRTLEATFAQDERLPIVRELLRLCVGRPRHTLPALMFCLSERVFKRPAAALAALADRGRSLRADLERALDGGVLIMPAHPRAAPRHRVPLLRPVDWVHTGLCNVLELPATSAPIGHTTAGLPLGVQIIGARGADAVTIAAARLLEEQGLSSSPPTPSRPAC